MPLMKYELHVSASSEKGLYGGPRGQTPKRVPALDINKVLCPPPFPIVWSALYWQKIRGGGQISFSELAPDENISALLYASLTLFHIFCGT